MKFRTFFTIAGICFFAIGCKTQNAKDYSDMIVKKQKSKNREKGFKASGLCIGFDCNYCGVQEG